jgi:polyisoprenoid-binding protein YceI
MALGEAMRLQFACAWMAMAWLGLAMAPADAAATRFALTPGPVMVGFRAYGMGVLPIDGAFARFDGVLALDDADPSACDLALRAEAASLHMPQQAMTDDALGPDLLDVSHFPDFRLDGRCEGSAIRGTLLLHGVSRPVVLAITRDAASWRASGLIQRADWGMGARPLLAGPEVRISITAGLPRTAPPAMPPPH